MQGQSSIVFIIATLICSLYFFVFFFVECCKQLYKHIFASSAATVLPCFAGLREGIIVPVLHFLKRLRAALGRGLKALEITPVTQS